ncbi:conjugal transfer protein TraD [Paraburkholderia oxyphila]|uniref:conjugal transfer protein TraD n=1 Tax=Paraburkholderia oxyphila TaxID=614212 RepID=UPI00069429F6|nr:conjugal transfer protein TraD [Paraburkholderia oxyphila]
MNDPWLNERIGALRALKTPTEHQRALLVLFDDPARGIDEERKLAALVKAEKAALRAQKARANATRALKEDRLLQRRARDQLAIVHSALIDCAVLENRDPGELLGALLCFIEQGAPCDRQSWKQAGDALIARQIASGFPAARKRSGVRISTRTGRPRTDSKAHGHHDP